MSGRIPEQIIEEIKQRSDIVDVVSSYVSLTKKSGQNLFGLCPFHQEKTPSFSVSSLKQMFYCFGCHKGGDVIRFIMDIEHMNYPEAIRFLGERCGVEVPEAGDDDARYREAKEHRERLYALNTEAARYFYRALQQPEAEAARDYMKRRGISRDVAIRFGLGYAPHRWQGLLDHLREKGFSPEEIRDSGLFKENRKGGLYDLFRGRLIFPIIDVMGRIVAFGGRVLDESLPKYLNSPETKIYTKGRHLYGLNLAKRTKEKRLLVVEGYMDCLSLHQAGIDHAVASLGTALTEQQAALLRKYREEIVLGYDMDRAGRQAVLKNSDVLEAKGAKPYVLVLPDTEDPDEYMQKHPADDFRYLLAQAPKGLEYKVIYAKERALQDGHLNKMQYQEEAAELLLGINNPVVRALYIPRVAEELSVPRESVEMLLEMKRSRQGGSRRKRTSYAAQRTPDKTSERTEEKRAGKPSAFTPLEAAFLAGVCRDADIFSENNLHFKAAWFKEKALRPLVKELKQKLEDKELNEQSMLDLINQEEDEEIRALLSSQFGALFMQDASSASAEQKARIMRRQILLLRSEYYARLSRYFSRKLDEEPPEEEAVSLRRRFKAVLRARKACEDSLNEMDNIYHFDEDSRDFG